MAIQRARLRNGCSKNRSPSSFYLIVFQLTGTFSVPESGMWYKHGTPGMEASWSKLCSKCFLRAGSEELTFFTVMAIFMQHEPISALACVATKGVDTFMLATTIVFGAFVLVWAGSNQQALSWQWETHNHSCQQGVPYPDWQIPVQTSNLCCWISPVSFSAQIQLSSTVLYSIKCIANGFYYIMQVLSS